MHCQICFLELPNHLEDCPVKTGRAVGPGDNYTAYAHDQLMERLRERALQAKQHQGMTHQHDPTSAELRIERLEKELALLATRVAKLERAQSPY